MKNNNDVDLSVVVPIYNAAKYIESTVKQIQAQTLKNVEVILVDDGSTDGSSELCDKFGNSDNRIKIIHKENGGASTARRAGAEAATARYLTFVDADDEIDPNLFEDYIRTIQEYDADIVTGEYMVIFPDRVSISHNEIADGVYTTEEFVTLIDRYVEYGRLGLGWNAWQKVYRTEIVQKATSFVCDGITKDEDLALTLACFALSDRIAVDSRICGYRYRMISDGSVTNTYDENSIAHTAKYIESTGKVLEYVRDRSDSIEYKNIWEHIIYHMDYTQIMNNDIGCALQHYGRKGLMQIYRFTKSLCTDRIMKDYFNKADNSDAFGVDGDRKRFVRAMASEKVLYALFLRFIKRA